MFFTSIKSGSINFLLLILFASPCYSQVISSSRFELAVDDGIENPRVASLQKDGILIYKRISDRSKVQLELIKIDTSLHENWRGTIAIDRNLTVSKVETNDHFIFILLNSVLYGGFDLHIIAVNIQTQEYFRYVVRNLIPLKPTEFKASSKAMLIGGYFNDIPVVLHFSLATGTTRLLPGFFNDQGELNQIKTYKDGLIDIVVSAKNAQRKKILWLRSYTQEGDLISSTSLQDPEKNILSGKSIRKPDGTLVVTGSFNSRNQEYSRGIFYAEINPNKEYSIKYYNFSDLENFYKYLKPSREARVKQRISRRKQKGKKIRHSYFLLSHELQHHGNDYLFLGEVYYPRYYYLNTFGYSSRGDRIFDGYRYTHAIIVGFNNKGELLWDNSLEINDIKTFTLVQFVKLAPSTANLGLLYLYENKVRSKIINRDKVVEEKTSNELNSKYDSDTIKEKDTEVSWLEYWYDPYFLAYGIQSIHNSRNERDNSAKRVLFINKVKFQ